jgi:hypothetical protein
MRKIQQEFLHNVKESERERVIREHLSNGMLFNLAKCSFAAPCCKIRKKWKNVALKV